MKTTIVRHEDKTIDLKITIPWQTITQTYEKVLNDAVGQVEIKGFRKGKAPRDLAEKELDKGKLYEEAIKRIMPDAYRLALSEHNIKPIMEPNIGLTKAKEGEDWEVTIVTCEKPAFTIENYKDLIAKAKGNAKAGELYIPGKDKPEKETEETIQDKKQKLLSAILDSLLQGIEIVIPAALIQEDVNRKLSSLVDQLTKLGLTIDSYCKSKNTTPEQLRQQYERETASTYKVEFILEELTEREKVTVEDKEIDAIIEKTADQKEKESMKQNRYYLASLLRRQKTLDKIISL